MPYVGHKPVLPQQNTNDWVHPFRGEGTYSNWALMSTTHLLEEVGHPDLPDHSEYNVRRRLWQEFTGEFEYKPMELQKYNHGGQNAHYLRYWWDSGTDDVVQGRFRGVPSAEVFTGSTLVSEATAAEKVMGNVASGRDYGTGDDLSFTIVVDGVSQPVILNQDYGTRSGYLTALNDAVTGATFTADDTTFNNLTVTSDTTGSSSSLELTSLTNGTGSGLEEFAEVTGANEVREGTWGHDGTRVLSTSRHSNHFFYGVPSADSTLEGTYWKSWDYENLPTYARRHEPYIYKGVGDDRIEGAGEPLDVKHGKGEEDLAYAFQRTQEWQGVPSAQAL